MRSRRFALVVALVAAAMVWPEAAHAVPSGVRKKKTEGAPEKPTAEFHVLAGRSLLQNAPAQARQNAVQALRLDPDNKDALDLLTVVYASQRERGLTHSAEVTLRKLEIQDYEQVIKAMPEWPDALYRCASQRIALHRLEPELKEELEKAVDELQRVVTGTTTRSAPVEERTSAHHQLGRALKHQGDQCLDEGQKDEAAGFYDKALGQFQDALDLDPNRVDSLGEIILIARARGGVAASMEMLGERVAGMTRESAQTKGYELLGALHAETGNREAAMSHLEKALALNPRLPGAYLTMTRLHIAAGELDLAENAMKRGLAEIPTHLEGHVNLGLFLMQRGRHADSVRAFEAAMKVPREKAVMIEMAPSPNLARNRYYYLAASSLAWLYLDSQDDPEMALKAVELAQKYQEADRHLLDTAGWIHFKAGDLDQAAEVLQKAIVKSGEGFPAAHYHLAAVYEKQGKKAEALREVAKALAAKDAFSDRKAAEALRRRLNEKD